MPGAPASSIITDNPHNGFQISSGDSINLPEFFLIYLKPFEGCLMLLFKFGIYT